MGQSKNVQIPAELFLRTIEVMEYIDVDQFAPDYQDMFRAVLDELREKRDRMDRREAYSALVAANKTGGEDAQHDARIDYLRRKP